MKWPLYHWISTRRDAAPVAPQRAAPIVLPDVDGSTHKRLLQLAARQRRAGATASPRTCVPTLCSNRSKPASRWTQLQVPTPAGRCFTPAPRVWSRCYKGKGGESGSTAQAARCGACYMCVPRRKPEWPIAPPRQRASTPAAQCSTAQRAKYVHMYTAAREDAAKNWPAAPARA